MTSFDTIVAPAPRGAALHTRDWSVLPWPLMGAGLLQCLAALLLNLWLQSEPDALRILLLTSGLLCAGIALALRLNSNRPAFAERILGPSREPLLGALAAFCLMFALAAVGILVTSFYDLPWFPWRTGMAVYLCIVVVPLSLFTARRTLQLQRQGRAVTATEESALMLLLASLCCFISCWALYLPGDPQSWDSMRLPLAVFTGVALIAAPLVLATSRVRRWTVSVLIMLHFSAIVTATLAAPPTPWVVLQAWTRLYRPYLEFMYLNNAYHFYAPEPGPSSYLWCRLIYQNLDDPEADLVGQWYKVPAIDEKTGRQQHRVALEYQRHLAMMSNVEQTDPVAFMNEATQEPLPFFRARQRSAFRTTILGAPAPTLVIPFHPRIVGAQQYARPNDLSRRLLSSYVRHVASLKAEAMPGYELRWIKVYRVRHDIVPSEAYAKLDPPLSASNPILYRPFYMGRYDLDGKLLDEPKFNAFGTLTAGDPFLYWLLPIETFDSTGVIHDYARLHAGDPRWMLLPDTDEWVTEDEAHLHLLRLSPQPGQSQQRDQEPSPQQEPSLLPGQASQAPQAPPGKR
jgi:hypothetical protein